MIKKSNSLKTRLMKNISQDLQKSPNRVRKNKRSSNPLKSSTRYRRIPKSRSSRRIPRSRSSRRIPRSSSNRRKKKRRHLKFSSTRTRMKKTVAP